MPLGVLTSPQPDCSEAPGPPTPAWSRRDREHRATRPARGGRLRGPTAVANATSAAPRQCCPGCSVRGRVQPPTGGGRRLLGPPQHAEGVGRGGGGLPSGWPADHEDSLKPGARPPMSGVCRSAQGGVRTTVRVRGAPGPGRRGRRCRVPGRGRRAPPRWAARAAGWASRSLLTTPAFADPSEGLLGEARAHVPGACFASWPWSDRLDDGPSASGAVKHHLGLLSPRTGRFRGEKKSTGGSERWCES